MHSLKRLAAKMRTSNGTQGSAHACMGHARERNGYHVELQEDLLQAARMPVLASRSNLAGAGTWGMLLQ
ncbi:MAG: hypothetical protein ACPIOQ_25330 [Promethearchaeia archaeon]